MKKKVLVLMLVFGFLVFATNAFALAPGSPFSFLDTTTPGAVFEWTHILDNTDFTPNLDGTEPYLIINSGWLNLSLNFTPAVVTGLPFTFYAFVAIQTLDNKWMSPLEPAYASLFPSSVTDWWWTAAITNPAALAAIADKSATMRLNVLHGTLNKVNYASLSGSGVVGPEPISMVLVGAGMAGLPFAKRLRRLVKRGD